MCKVEDSHRDRRSSARDTLIRESWRLGESEKERRVRQSVKLKTVTEIRRSSARDTLIKRAGG